VTKPPSPNGANGERDGAGRFVAGNPGGPGNPYARRVARLRKVLLDAVTEDDVREVVGALVRQAKSGDVAAVRELLTRVVGKPVEALDPDRIDLYEMQLDSELETERVCRSLRMF